MPGAVPLDQFTQSQALLSQNGFDFSQTGFAKVFIAEQIVLSNPEQIANVVQSHALEAVTAAHRQLEIGYGNFENLAVAIDLTLLVLIVVHTSGAEHIFEVELSTGVVRIG